MRRSGLRLEDDDIVDDHVVEGDPARMPRAHVTADSELILCVLEPELECAARHSRQLDEHMSDAVRRACPGGHILEIVRVEVARQMFRVVLGRTGRERSMAPLPASSNAGAPSRSEATAWCNRRGS